MFDTFRLDTPLRIVHGVVQRQSIAFDTDRCYIDTPLNNGLYEESYNDGTIEHDSEPSTELLGGMDNG